jgi:hypothetical protein
VSRLAWTLAALALVLAVPGATVSIWLRPSGSGDVTFAIVCACIAVASSLTGATVASRLPDNSVGWLVLAQGVGAGVIIAMGGYSAVGVGTTTDPLPGQQVAALVGEILGTLVLFGVTGMLLQLFPTGRPLTPRWTSLAWLFAIVVTTAAISTALLSPTAGLDVTNGYHVQGGAAVVMRRVADVTNLLGPPALLLSAVSLILRLRRSRGMERQQLKWFTFCAAVAGVGLGLTIVTGDLASDVAFLVGTTGIILMPVTAAVAILRHRLYDIDIVINRTLVYGALTAVLVATYLVSVLAFRLVLDPLTGKSDLAIAVSTLAVAALFRPLRSRIQHVVDRRFFRQRYDAAHTLEEFSGRLRQQVDLEAVSSDLRTVVRSTMQPAHVTLWLRSES